ncbi:MAG: type 4a pilus biogenesis protein PilO [Desulfobulbaceae bacterium]|jgi:type IV pilus assembly protein PilO|nr:type 4a pilus biogenesis protein PilO [Desulfobulbaceae bacterium]
MKKSNAALTTFLDEKYIPLAPRIKLGIAVVIALLPLLVFYFALYQPNSTKIGGLENQKTTLTQEVKDVEAKAANLAKFEKELEDAMAVFQETSVLLPKDKEIPKLLKDISALGRNAGLDFLTFKPLADVPKDFYAEIPVTINVRGPYHNMGYFFDQVSKLERIVSVSNIKMSSPKKDGGEMLLNSDCTLLTYRFTNVELPKPPKK